MKIRLELAKVDPKTHVLNSNMRKEGLSISTMVKMESHTKIFSILAVKYDSRISIKVNVATYDISRSIGVPIVEKLVVHRCLACSTITKGQIIFSHLKL